MRHFLTGQIRVSRWAVIVAIAFLVGYYIPFGPVIPAPVGAQPGSFGGAGHFTNPNVFGPPTAAAGAQAGGSPPAPVVAASAGDTRGSLTFGTGTAPALGAEVVITFAQPYVTAPFMVVNPQNVTTAGTGVGQCGVYVSATTTTTATINCIVAPAASQANTVYAINWFVVQ